MQMFCYQYKISDKTMAPAGMEMSKYQLSEGRIPLHPVLTEGVFASFPKVLASCGGRDQSPAGLTGQGQHPGGVNAAGGSLQGLRVGLLSLLPPSALLRAEQSLGHLCPCSALNCSFTRCREEQHEGNSRWVCSDLLFKNGLGKEIDFPSPKKYFCCGIKDV